MEESDLPDTRASQLHHGDDAGVIAGLAVCKSAWCLRCPARRGQLSVERPQVWHSLPGRKGVVRVNDLVNTLWQVCCCELRFTHTGHAVGCALP